MEAFEFFQPMLLSLFRYGVILIASYLITWCIFPYLSRMISESNLVKPNYRGESIPVAGGLIFIVLLPIITGFGLKLSIASFSTIQVFLFLFVILGAGFMGFLDDQLGNNLNKGFRGHLSALIKEKRLTTGGFKLIFGAIIAMVFSIGTAKFLKTGWAPWPIIANFLLICLATNIINIFDLRPGRAGKIYIVGFILVLAFGTRSFQDYLGLFLPIMAIMFYYLPLDLKASIMMGDTGSNLLGASLGMMMAWMLSDVGKVVALIILVFLQLAAEKVSFSEVIEKVHILKVLDQLGRRK